MNKPRLIILVAFIFTIVSNMIFFLKYVSHFGGGMTYAVVEAEKEVFRNVYKREPVDFELHLEHAKLLDRLLFIEWHDNWKEKFSIARTSFLPGDVFYFLTQDSGSRNLAAFGAQGYQSFHVRSVSFFDAPPLFFAVLRTFRALVPEKLDRAIHVYRLTVPAEGSVP